MNKQQSAAVLRSAVRAAHPKSNPSDKYLEKVAATVMKFVDVSKRSDHFSEHPEECSDEQLLFLLLLGANDVRVCILEALIVLGSKST